MENNENVNVKLEDDFKPRKWLLVLLIIIMGAIIGVLIYYGINDYKEYRKNHPTVIDKVKEKSDDFDKEFEEAKEKAKEASKEIEVKQFNGTIEMYSGTKYGNQVVNVIDEIITSNKKNPDHLITVTFNGQTSSDPETIRGYKSNLDSWTQYEVIMDYDENGYINKVEVRK